MICPASASSASRGFRPGFLLSYRAALAGGVLGGRRQHLFPIFSYRPRHEAVRSVRPGVLRDAPGHVFGAAA